MADLKGKRNLTVGRGEGGGGNTYCIDGLVINLFLVKTNCMYLMCLNRKKDVGIFTGYCKINN